MKVHQFVLDGQVLGTGGEIKGTYSVGEILRSMRQGDKLYRRVPFLPSGGGEPVYQQNPRDPREYKSVISDWAWAQLEAILL